MVGSGWKAGAEGYRASWSGETEGPQGQGQGQGQGEGKGKVRMTKIKEITKRQQKE